MDFIIIEGRGEQREIGREMKSGRGLGVGECLVGDGNSPIN